MKLPTKWTTIRVNGKIHQMTQEKHDNILNYSKDAEGEINWPLFMELIEKGTPVVMVDTYQPTDEDFAAETF